MRLLAGGWNGSYVPCRKEWTDLLTPDNFVPKLFLVSFVFHIFAPAK